MRFSLPKIYPITDKTLSGISHAEQVLRLIDGGATCIQLRDKRLSPKAFLQEAEAAWKVADHNNVKLIINDRVDIAMALGTSGVHLGQDDLPVEAAKNLLKNEDIIGLSTHNLQQVEIAAASLADYVALGPVFATVTKKDPEPSVGLAIVRRAKATLATIPLVAIGGITTENVRSVLEAGADSVAVISAVVAEPSRISANMRRMLDSARE